MVGRRGSRMRRSTIFARFWVDVPQIAQYVLPRCRSPRRPSARGANRTPWPTSRKRTAGAVRRQAAAGLIAQSDKCRPETKSADESTTGPGASGIRNAAKGSRQHIRRPGPRRTGIGWRTSGSRSRPCGPTRRMARFSAESASSTTSGPYISTPLRTTGRRTGRPEQGCPGGPGSTSTGFCVGPGSLPATKCCARTAISSSITNGSRSRSKESGRTGRPGSRR